MGLDDVVAAVDRVESLLADGETGPVQDSLSWQQTDADIQLGKACAMLGTCQQLRDGSNNFVSIVELSFNAIERSLQFYLGNRRRRTRLTIEITGKCLNISQHAASFPMKTSQIGSMRSALNTDLESTTTQIVLDKTSLSLCTN